MITDKELQTLLMECYNTLQHYFMVDNPELFIAQLSENILLTTEKRPLPSYRVLSSSHEARTVFQTMIRQSIDVLSAELVHSTKIAHLKQNFEAELTHLKTTNNNNPDQLNALLQQAIALNLIGFADRRPLQYHTGINLDVFKAGLTKDFSLNQLNDFKEAFLWFIARHEHKLLQKDDELSFSRHLNSELAKISLALHSQQCVSEIEKESGPIHIIHFYETTASFPRAAEYLESYDSDEERELAPSFEKTSHGLGSGVYGLGALSQDEIDYQINELKSNFKLFEIQRPLRLIDDETNHESDKYTQISKKLQRICDNIKRLRYASKYTGTSRLDVIRDFFAVPENNHDLNELAKTLCEFQNIQTPVDDMSSFLLDAIQEFSIHADRRLNAIVPMPINYLLKKIDFTGVVSSLNDRFNRGLIAIELEDTTNLALIPVKSLAHNPNSPHQAIRTSPWNGALTPTSRSSSSEIRPSSPISLFTKTCSLSDDSVFARPKFY